VLVVTVCQQQR